MTETNGIQFVARVVIYTTLHFALFLAAAVFGDLIPMWVIASLCLFTMLAETFVSSVIDYQGQDAIQWPIIVLNSALYGCGLAWLHAFLIARASTRPAPIPAGSGGSPARDSD